MSDAKVAAVNENAYKKVSFLTLPVRRGLKDSIPNFLNKTNGCKDSKNG